MVSLTSPVGADVNEVSGSAFALEAHALGIINIPPTPAGVSGSANEATGSYQVGPTAVLGPIIVVPGLLSLGAIEAETRGGDVTGDNHLGFAESFAEVADLDLGSLLLPALSAEVIRSECRSDGDGSTGLTELVNAQLGGGPLAQFPVANTPIIIGDPLAPIATAILNEQTEVNVPGVATSIIVTAIHITVLPSILTGLAPVDIIIGRTACAAQGPDVLITTTTTGPTTTTTGPTTTTTGGTTTTTSGGGTTTTTSGGGTTTTTSGGGTTTTTGGGGTTTTTGGGGTTTTGGGNVTTTTGGGGNTSTTGGGNVTTTGGGGGGGGNVTTPGGGAGGGGGIQNVGTLARTGSDAQRVITLAFLALVLGGLFLLGSKGLTSEPVPAKAKARRNTKGIF
jgi:hypothetical protein